MDRQQRTLDIVVSLNKYQDGQLERHFFLEKVCDYFDFIKDQELDDSDYRFLIYLSSKAGVPHYYDILNKFKNKTLLKNEENVKLDVISSLIFETKLYTNKNSKLHLYQKEVLDLFNTKKINRFFLSASTSFGKTHLVYEIINKMSYKNIILIFPSIALLSENISKIKEKQTKLNINYKIHTLSDAKINKNENNLLIFTPERYLSFLDKDQDFIADFIFVDEVYKIDNSYIIDEESKENERDIAYRMSLYLGLTLNLNVDLFIAGPYIEVSNNNALNYKPSFDLFLDDFNIKKLLFNEYEIVKVNKYSAANTTQINIDTISIDIKKNAPKKEKIQKLLDSFLEKKENTIIYCNTKSYAEKVAREYNKSEINTNTFLNFLRHLEKTFDKRWIVITSLKKGIGVHHGVIPKYIQKEIIDLFNKSDSVIKVLSATTTITEGVNTTAKNMIVYNSSKGGGKHIKPLLKFDAKNIAGRAGRFMEHYVGRVITLDDSFLNVIENEGKPIEHKNYDKKTEKNEVEYDMTKPEYLDHRTKQLIDELKKNQTKLGIPNHILDQFKVISKKQKLDIYEKITRLNSSQLNLIKHLIRDLNLPSMRLNRDGFQIILNLILPQVDNEHLKNLITTYYPKEEKQYSILYIALNKYITQGFFGNYDYFLERTKNQKLLLKIKREVKNAEKVNKTIDISTIELNEDEISLCVDSAMKESAELIFNTFKYQLVKYLGIFNLMYKYYISTKEMKLFDEISGIDILLAKLEYNAFSEKAKIASDYGVPSKIVDYYDAKTLAQANKIKQSFDAYENTIYNRVSKLIE